MPVKNTIPAKAVAPTGNVKPTVKAETTAKVVPAKVEPAKKAEQPKPKFLAIMDPRNPLGLAAGDNAITKAYDLIQKNKLVEAKAVIEPTYTWLNDATEYHTGLYKVLKDLDTAQTQADLERDLALKFAILRDKAAYQLALLYMEDGRPKDAVKKLVDVVRSQPTTKLGFESYQILQQLGFTYKAQMVEQTAEEIK